MKITAKQYARYLYQATNNKEKEQLKEIIKNFVKILKDNNELTKINQIVEQFIEIWHFEKKIILAEIVSAKKIGMNTEKLLKNYIKEINKASEVIIEKKIDKSLLGGVVIKYNDKILDGSLKNSLKELKNKLIN
ncbi:MAG: ATP synthase F1 subunit delta [Patescibacteria group bacterium]